MLDSYYAFGISLAVDHGEIFQFITGIVLSINGRLCLRSAFCITDWRNNYDYFAQISRRLKCPFGSVGMRIGKFCEDWKIEVMFHSFKGMLLIEAKGGGKRLHSSGRISS